jgi:hypothetical protein
MNRNKTKNMATNIVKVADAVASIGVIILRTFPNPKK